MKKYVYILMASSLLMACGGDSSEHEETVVESVAVDSAGVTEETSNRVAKAQMVFKTIPSPLETATLFQDAGAGYNTSLTNPVENVRSYVTNIQKSLNLGVYGADLSFANIFDQSQESMFYINCAKILADGLGVTSAFSVETMERMEENMNNRDSLMTLINDAFWITDGHMKDNGQDHLSALIITGGWIEGLYLGVMSIDKAKPDKKLMQRIADQKYSLNSLVELLETYEHREVTDVYKSMLSLQKVYNKVEVKGGETTVSENNGVTTIGGGGTLTFQTETILEITSVIEKIRNDIIQ